MVVVVVEPITTPLSVVSDSRYTLPCGCMATPTTPDKKLNYNDTLMASAVKLPYHTLQESPNSRGITVCDWQISAWTHPISNATELDAIQASVGIPMPEMTFGNNILELEHKPSGWKYEFNTTRALKEVKNGPLEEGDGGVKVGYAEAWLKSRCITVLRLTFGIKC